MPFYPVRNKATIHTLSLRAVVKIVSCLLGVAFSSCTPSTPVGEVSPTAIPQQEERSTVVSPTPLPTRPIYQPGELVTYEAQPGDTIPALAAHFNTTEKEIFKANPIIPADVTTLPPGLPMNIPIYYQALWGSPYQILPDSLFVNGPAQSDFDAVAFVLKSPGWFKNYEFYTSAGTLKGGALINHLASNFSISPRVLLALVEFQTGALSSLDSTKAGEEYPLGYQHYAHQGLYRQLTWAANILNNGYYGWRTGKLTSFELADGSLERLDPWQNAATVALHHYFAQTMSGDQYQQTIHSQGFKAVYESLFGVMPEDIPPHIPGNLKQPAMNFPFELGKSWAFTGGPHTGWGTGEPFSALDFAPPAVVGGCNATEEWATAVANGVIARKSTAIAELDLDGDGNERTGWVLFHLHLSTESIPPVGARLKAGDPIGHPSCEGGISTGTHVHIARKYNGEWITASGPLAFNLEGWIAASGNTPYEGTMTRFSHSIHACVCSDRASQIQSGGLKISQ
ncbi:MAG: LysM peptidoglycan-binding domain-containing protein [Anaerolineaceae bacterium]|nr:LysM peptidoglycan-binding domain-containing protein [Anaerolineaceae bacterium]